MRVLGSMREQQREARVYLPDWDLDCGVDLLAAMVRPAAAVPRGARQAGRQRKQLPIHPSACCLPVGLPVACLLASRWLASFLPLTVTFLPCSSCHQQQTPPQARPSPPRVGDVVWVEVFGRGAPAELRGKIVTGPPPPTVTSKGPSLAVKSPSPVKGGPPHKGPSLVKGGRKAANGARQSNGW